MADIKETWQAAVAERGDRAFELFEVETIQKWWVNLDSNDTAEKWVVNENQAWLRLKPIVELVKLDIDRYGDNAYLMYKEKDTGQLRSHDLFLSNDCLIISDIELERKLYAGVPFNLEWAKSGVAVEAMSILPMEWIPVKFCNQNKLQNWVLLPGWEKAMFSSSNLRHPFPPLCYSLKMIYS